LALGRAKSVELKDFLAEQTIRTIKEWMHARDGSNVSSTSHAQEEPAFLTHGSAGTVPNLPMLALISSWLEALVVHVGTQRGIIRTGPQEGHPSPQWSRGIPEEHCALKETRREKHLGRATATRVVATREDSPSFPVSSESSLTIAGSRDARRAHRMPGVESVRLRLREGDPPDARVYQHGLSGFGSSHRGTHCAADV
jgi:hypothetical protein